tara:strand:+ start:343 stop:558 length:216 start_codon:yes stop_codon:yes gene_type:complete
MSIDGKGLIWRSGIVEDDDVFISGNKAKEFPCVQQGLCSSLDDLFRRLNETIWYVISEVGVIHRNWIKEKN